jgi:ribosomal subunit interface protein
MTINIHGTGIELTDAIKEYAEEKMGSLTKFFDNIQQINIDVGKQSQHHHKGDVYYAEANVLLPGVT